MASVSAARSDGGTQRADWSATALARINSVIATSLKNGLHIIHDGLETVRAPLHSQPRPLPLADQRRGLAIQHSPTNRTHEPHPRNCAKVRAESRA